MKCTNDNGFMSLRELRDKIEDIATQLLRNDYANAEDDETIYCAIDKIGVIADFEDNWEFDVRCFVRERRVYADTIYVPAVLGTPELLACYIVAYILGYDDRDS